MINNLKLGSTTGTLNLTPANTNIPSGSWDLPQLTTTDESSYQVKQAIGPIPAYSVTDHNSEYFGGYLYNFLAATAGWGTTAQERGNSPQDICPKNWRLPTGGPGGEFQTLSDIIAPSGTGAGGWTKTDVWGGVYADGYNSGFLAQGMASAYYSATAVDNKPDMAYVLGFFPTLVEPTETFYKNGAGSVRCVIG